MLPVRCKAGLKKPTYLPFRDERADSLALNPGFRNWRPLAQEALAVPANLNWPNSRRHLSHQGRSAEVWGDEYQARLAKCEQYERRCRHMMGMSSGKNARPIPRPRRS
ncbi:hypothetical protein GCM10010985_30570 [Caballeronia grimmiae]|uniref:Uncharacterized protein n=1 Tax=Caballeronia grimmiae TaxID=1071679 RepID=A0ABQ1RPR5_9BURK|nr:hypothetical protein GCM10010985_30570 [Caballeronia grimmiae]